jgi:hypothetical protein
VYIFLTPLAYLSISSLCDSATFICLVNLSDVVTKRVIEARVNERGETLGLRQG